MLVRPMEVYKYKSVSTRQDFERLRDIILNNHIYMPSPLMLNDPMEANAVVMSLGIMGSGYIRAEKFIHLLKKNKKDIGFCLCLQFPIRRLCGRTMQKNIVGVALSIPLKEHCLILYLLFIRTQHLSFQMVNSLMMICRRQFKNHYSSNGKIGLTRMSGV